MHISSQLALKNTSLHSLSSSLLLATIFTSVVSCGSLLSAVLLTKAILLLQYYYYVSSCFNQYMSHTYCIVLPSVYVLISQTPCALPLSPLKQKRIQFLHFLFQVS